MKMVSAEVKIPLSILAVLVMFTNGVVCFLVCINKNLRTYTNGFIVSLAVSDILVGVTLFLQYALSVKEAVTLNILYTTALVGSVANLSAVTFDRYVACMRPFNYANTIVKSFFPIVAFCWIMAVVCAVIPLSWTDSDVAGLALRIYQICILLLGIAIPYVCIFISYVRISRQVRKIVTRERKLVNSVKACPRADLRARRVSSEAKVTKVFVVIAVMFVLSWLPIIWTTLVYALGKPQLLPKHVALLSPFTLAFGSIVNPLLYSFMKPDFKSVFRKLFHLNKVPQRSRREQHLSRNNTSEFPAPSAVTTPSTLNLQSVALINISQISS